LLAELLHESIGALDRYEFPSVSKSAFVDLIRELKANQKEWSWSLCDAMIKADDLIKSGEKKDASAILEQFIGQCPWKFYRVQAARLIE
jgi:hypothetical protein